MNPWKKQKNLNDIEINGKYIKKSHSNYDNTKTNDPSFFHNFLNNQYQKYKKCESKAIPHDDMIKAQPYRNKIECFNNVISNNVCRDIDKKINLSDVKDKYVIKDNKTSLKTYIIDHIIRRNPKKHDSDELNKNPQSNNHSNLFDKSLNNSKSMTNNKLSNKQYHFLKSEEYILPNLFSTNEMNQTQHTKTLPIVPANPFLNAKIPDWLLIYSVAPFELDNNLKWDIFSLQQLESFEAILKRLYMQELEKIVMKYESYRTILSKQIEHCLYNNIKKQKIMENYLGGKFISFEPKQNSNENQNPYHKYYIDKYFIEQAKNYNP